MFINTKALKFLKEQSIRSLKGEPSPDFGKATQRMLLEKILTGDADLFGHKLRTAITKQKPFKETNPMLNIEWELKAEAKNPSATCNIILTPETPENLETSEAMLTFAEANKGRFLTASKSFFAPEDIEITMRCFTPMPRIGVVEDWRTGETHGCAQYEDLTPAVSVTGSIEQT